MNDVWQKIGSQIKEKRTQRGMTQGDLGAKVGTQRQFISNIENGHRKCSVEKLDEIAGALECELKVIFED